MKLCDKMKTTFKKNCGNQILKKMKKIWKNYAKTYWRKYKKLCQNIRKNLKDM